MLNISFSLEVKSNNQPSMNLLRPPAQEADVPDHEPITGVPDPAAEPPVADIPDPYSTIDFKARSPHSC